MGWEIVYEAMASIGSRMGVDRLGQAGRLLGRALWLGMPARRRMATRAVAFHLGLDQARARRVAKASFVNNATSFLEIFHNHRVDWRFLAERVRLADPEATARHLALQAPVVATSAHLGAWELDPALWRLLDHDRPKAAVVRQSGDAAFIRLMERLRRRPTLDIYGHRRVAGRVLRLLKRGGGVAFLVDHNTPRREAVFLPFLGEVAAVNAGPALLALRAGAVVMPNYVLRQDTDAGARYQVITEEPLDTRKLQGTLEEKVDAVCRFYTASVERMVRAHPEQWFWMHKRWKTRPPDEAGGGKDAPSRGFSLPTRSKPG